MVPNSVTHRLLKAATLAPQTRPELERRARAAGMKDVAPLVIDGALGVLLNRRLLAIKTDTYALTAGGERELERMWKRGIP